MHWVSPPSLHQCLKPVCAEVPHPSFILRRIILRRQRRPATHPQPLSIFVTLPALHWRLMQPGLLGHDRAPLLSCRPPIIKHLPTID